jgi:hypothetical protein
MPHTAMELDIEAPLQIASANVTNPVQQNPTGTDYFLIITLGNKSVDAIDEGSVVIKESEKY